MGGFFCLDFYNVYAYSADMRRTLLAFFLCLPLPAQVPTPELNKQLTELAKTLASVTYDSKKPITVEGRATTMVWPEGTSGIVVIETAKGERYAFSTAGVPAMAKQGFTRFALSPGTAVKVTGLLAPGNGMIGSSWIAGRADTIDKADGKRIFDRAKLPGGAN